MRSSVWVLGGVKINFLYSGSRGDDTMTIMTVIVSSVSESLSDVFTSDGGGGGGSIIGSRAHGNMATPGISTLSTPYIILTLAYLHHTLQCHIYPKPRAT